jgi:deoxyhypusine synthase
MNVAANSLLGGKLLIDVNLDVNETAAIVYDAKQSDQTSATLMIGGGSPKNFILQTEPQIQEVLGLEERGHDYYLQFTDARPDTGGLSGATPAEAVSWGKVDPERLPDADVCYVDSTIGVPLLAAYAMTQHAPRKLRRLYERREKMVDRLREMFRQRWSESSDPRDLESEA